MKGTPGEGHDIVVIGCSAGGVEALPKLLSKLPRDTPAAIFVVMHVAAMAESYLPRIIGRTAKMPCEHAQPDEGIQHGKIYVAPPDRHMMLTENTVTLSHGSKENRHRPAVDPLFRSAARIFGSRVIGVILTGALDDGTAGLQSINRCGGITMVQHPDEALVPGMPMSALRYVQADHVGKLNALGALLRKLIKEPPNNQAEVGCHEDAQTTNQRASMNHQDMEKLYGAPSALVCPECSGPIWEADEGQHTQYRCVVGHVYSPESFVAEEGIAAERALWVAVKTLQERADLLKRLAEKAAAMNQTITARAHRTRRCRAPNRASTHLRFAARAAWRRFFLLQTKHAQSPHSPPHGPAQIRQARRLRGAPATEPRRSRSPLQRPAHQRHRVFPRSRSLPGIA